MVLLSLLLSLSLFVIVESVFTTIRNNCAYNVSLVRINELMFEYEAFPVIRMQTLTQDSSTKFEVRSSLSREIYQFSTGCKPVQINWILECDTDKRMKGCLCKDCCSETSLECEVELNHTGKHGPYHSSYQIINRYGYNLPVRVSPIRDESFACDSIICNVSLDDCPEDEDYGIGDLRVRIGNKTIACTSPCTKLSYPPPTGKGQPRKECTKDKYHNLRYLEVLKIKCPSAPSEVFDEKIQIATCVRNSDTLPSFEIVTCP